ncbi:hypothetical protein COO91_09939 (plasmid) [Nostoc flagelliforme CCNUN1]|uniref:Uncharacterized protein n=1 Tax=Nostoc flagelliforme CCNUN1 TaxID=2038116 RepID=A0A2K8T7X8_9NOSO|nr:hypothetical protein COO91_09939 [Nostoc flagelliforme CCNUN1]
MRYAQPSTSDGDRMNLWRQKNLKFDNPQLGLLSSIKCETALLT